MNLHPSRIASLRSILIVCSLVSASSAWADDDPPSRVARLAYIAGDVTFAPSGTDQWDQASINRPLTTGDRILTEDNSRAAMDTDGGDLRIGDNTGFNLLRLDDNGTQIELSRGTLNWRIDNVNNGQSNEVDTPTIAFVATQPGTYKIDVAEDGSSTIISIVQGAGTVYGEGGASYPISGRQSWRFGDSALRDISGMPLAQADDFDLWCNDRDARARTVVQNDYVSPDVIGYTDLADNGDWDNVADYGNVWYPRAVASDWAPYRFGHWAWVAPWGWTWIDDAPWGFAPFHYGRWVYVSNRWGWVPGPRQVRPVYCPAMVAFVGGNGWSVSVSSGQPIGWVPLGPRDVYVPWYRGSSRYVTNVNVTNVVNINRTTITNVYNDRRNNRNSNIRYMNQNAPGGTTVVNREAFSNGRRVNGAQLSVDATQLQRAPTMHWNDMPAGRPGQGARVMPSARAPSQEFTRPSVFHRAPPSPAYAQQPGRGTGPSWNNERNQQPDRINIDARDNSPINNAPIAGRPEPRDNFDRRDSASPTTPQQRENDPRWSNDVRRNNDPNNGNMPSSRFSPWRNRADNHRDAAPSAAQVQPQAQPQQPQIQGRDNDPSWVNNRRRDLNAPQGNTPGQPWGNRAPSAPAPAPAQAPVPSPQPAPQPQPFERHDIPRDGSRWGNNARGDSGAVQNSVTPPVPQQQTPQIRQEPIQASPPRQAVPAPRPEPQVIMPTPAPREQPQPRPEPQNVPAQRPAPEFRPPVQNRPEREPRPRPERPERPELERR